MLIPSKVTRVWSWTSKRHKNAQIAGICSADLFYSRLRLGWQFTRDMGWTILLSWSVYYFSPHPGRKYHIRVFEPGAKVALSARVWWKSTFRISSQISVDLHICPTNIMDTHYFGVNIHYFGSARLLTTG